jgi:outer membrane receptor protein involved in Fe transport
MRTRSRRPSSDIAIAVSVVLRSLAVCGPVALVDPATSAAQTAEVTADIPAQPLARALGAFAGQTGLQLVYVSGVVRDQRSYAVSAPMSAPEALARLLQGAGLRFEYLTSHSVRILDARALPKPAAKAGSGDHLPEVIVTANRREENLQDVPITIQVLTGATLSRLNITTFDDLVSYLPGVTAHGVGPSQNNIYIRGLGTGDYSNQAAGSNGSFPNVAIYLDEQSAQLPGRNLDIYAADLERIEVLEGPQGTLFGAGAQAGVLRYITNKPKLDATEANVSADYSSTAHGDPSSALQAMINVPLIADHLAARAVIYDEKRGGYIDNIPATFARSSADRSIYYAGGTVPASSVVINNAAVVGNDINPVTYSGIRVEGLYQFNNDWSALIAQSYQNMEAQGVFAEMAAASFGKPQPDLTVELFNPSFDKDRFENTALTVEGRVADLKLVYAGAYLVRNIEQVQDYTAYAHNGFYVDYYQCVNPGPTPAAAKCFTPSSTWRDVQRNSHLTQELRFNTPDDWRVRGVGGVFYENYRIQDQGDWFYLTAFPYFYPVGPPTGYFTFDGQPACGCQKGATLVPSPVTLNNPNVRPLRDAYFNDITRGYKQKAAYGSVDVDLIPGALTLTAGTRYFDTNTTEVGAIAGSFGCQLAADPPNPCIDHGQSVDLNQEGLYRTYSGFRSRANLSWKPNQDALLYYTWSQGFRAGGFNRIVQTPGGSPLTYVAKDWELWQALAHEHGGWSAPLAYAPDTLTNNELGWKTAWLDEHLQWTGALYQEDWNHAQIDSFAARVLSGVTINGGNYRVRGLETFARARAAGLTLEAGIAWNHSELVKEAPFFWADGTPINFALLQTSATGSKLTNPAGTLGSSLAGDPTFQGNFRARYEFVLNDYRAFSQIGVVHQSDSLSTTDRLTLDLQGQSVAYELPSFTTYEAALGVGRDRWLMQAYGENLTDTRAQLFANYSLGYKAVTVNRPRTLGLRLTYNFVSNN